MKIVTIVGCRPQFIKAAVVSRELEREEIEEVIIHTGQHYDQNMSDIFFHQLGIPTPKYNMNVNHGPAGSKIGKMIIQAEVILDIERPDYVLVYGDTDSTLAGAIAANKLGIKVIHVEAGLRNGDKTWPEEMNRILTDNIASLLLCPTLTAYNNLVNEGNHESDSVHFTGDVMYDSAIRHHKTLNVKKEGYILCTVHRAHNMENLDVIIDFLNTLPNVLVVAHPKVYHAFNSPDNVFETIESVDYLMMLALVRESQLVITDSGGLQKEASFLEKKCLILNKTTSWVELLEGGTHLLIKDMTVEGLRKEYVELIGRTSVMFHNAEFGHGDAGKQIVRKIKRYHDKTISSTTSI